MPSTTTDRLYGLTTSVAVKASVKAATHMAITAYGEQTIDGVSCVTGDRVLRKNEGNAVLNGIWIVQTGDWTRAADFNGSLDTVTGTLVEVNYGAINEVTIWRCTSEGVIVIGTSPITWEQIPFGLGDNTLLVPMEFLGTPDAGQIIGIYVCKDSATFASNLDGGAGFALGGYVGTNPASSCAISLQVNDVEVGVITISTSGIFSVVCAEWSVVEDDVVTFVAPDPATDAADIAMTFAGVIG